MLAKERPSTNQQKILHVKLKIDRFEKFLKLIHFSLLTLRFGPVPHPCTSDDKGDLPSPSRYLSRFVRLPYGRFVSHRKLSANRH